MIATGPSARGAWRHRLGVEHHSAMSSHPRLRSDGENLDARIVLAAPIGFILSVATSLSASERSASRWACSLRASIRPSPRSRSEGRSPAV